MSSPGRNGELRMLFLCASRTTNDVQHKLLKKARGLTCLNHQRKVILWLVLETDVSILMVLGRNHRIRVVRVTRNRLMHVRRPVEPNQRISFSKMCYLH